MPKPPQSVSDQPHPGGPSPSGAAPNPWDQLPGEPPRWYGRFHAFLMLGPTRTIRATIRASHLTRNSSWGEYAQRWQWRERAAAWDAYQRNLLALSERNVRIGLRRRRVAVIEEYIEAVRAVLDSADMHAADQEQARQWLPQMRIFLRDLLTAERLEYERADYAKDDPDNAALITADDLRAAQRALDREQAQAAQAIAASVAGAANAGAPARTLFVCAGADSAFMIDLAVLRGVRAATGLQFRRLLDATRPKFATHLRRERGLDRPVELLHLALHASPEGVQFADGLADGSWLSERLGGVRVMLLAGCESEGVGDWLSVVPYVITLSEEITHEDAAALTQHFWHNIGLGQEPGAALDAALAHCPPVVAEYVTRHW